MGETRDIESAVTRAQQTGRIQPPTPEQEELRRRRFELERARENAEKRNKGRAVPKADPVDRGGEEQEPGTKKETGEGGIDVRV